MKITKFYFNITQKQFEQRYEGRNIFTAILNNLTLVMIWLGDGVLFLPHVGGPS